MAKKENKKAMVELTNLVSALDEFLKPENKFDKAQNHYWEKWKKIKKKYSIFVDSLDEIKYDIEPSLEDMEFWNKEYNGSLGNLEAYEIAKQYKFQEKHCKGCKWNEIAAYDEEHFIDGDLCGKDKYYLIGQYIKHNSQCPKKKWSCYEKK